uniref:DUF659 domain-containing protein n=1 Tax=Tanacetum cinerariifolium TaxID=118510 RepID=A0A6L2JCV8_TANCI|nr:hypothetical protein [Tanacetum cinerariifolium]
MSSSTSNSVETTVEVESKNTKKRKKPQKKPAVKKGKSKRWSKVWLDFDEQDLEDGEYPEEFKAKFDELPFSFVEREGFRHYSKINQPLFDVPCRGTTTQDCYKLYDEEKIKLLNVIQKNIGRVCLTTDGWTSLGKKSYMALTGHFIDNEWKLNKKVDNESANDSAIDFLRKTSAKKDNCLLNGKWIHIKCAAHSLNLIVQDGIKSVDMSIQNIRYAVKWIKKSGSRIEKFKRCAESAKCDIKKNLILDVPTRSVRTSPLAYDPEVERSARLRRKAVRQFSTNLDFAGLKELFTEMSDDDATGAESSP